MFSSPVDTKSARTRRQLRDVALRLFRERGYDATTMRVIAQEAGVSVGNAYYHFATKNDLVQELYLDVQERHRLAAAEKLGGVDDLVERIAVAFRTGLDELSPYRPHAAEFVSAALAPRSDVNPLSAASSPARAITETIFADAVAGARRGSLPDDLAAALPAALFLAHLLLALFWAYDGSDGQERTHRLLDRGIRLLRVSLPLARLPLARGVVREMLALVAEAGR